MTDSDKRLIEEAQSLLRYHWYTIREKLMPRAQSTECAARLDDIMWEKCL